jgi:hypothetical protein
MKTPKTKRKPATVATAEAKCHSDQRLVRRREIIEAISAELNCAYFKHGCDQWGRHEFYAILKEEVDELWDAIKADEPQDRVVAEAIQVAAMCFRYIETRDRYREPSNIVADLQPGSLSPENPANAANNP